MVRWSMRFFLWVGVVLGGISWPLKIAPGISSSPWFGVLTDRAKEVSWYDFES